MIKTIFFDFDGVLTPDKSGSYTTFNYISKKTDIDFEKLHSCSRKYNKELNLGKLNFKDIWKEFCECINEDLDIGILGDAFECTELNKAMFGLAKKLSKEYKVGILTDNKKGRLEILNKKFGLDKLFSPIIVSSELGLDKTNEQMFKTAITSAKANTEECIFIDNKKENLLLPKK